MNGNKPNLTLNIDDRIYLAVARRELGKLTFVYTLACLRTNKHSATYNMVATREVHTFRDNNAAEMYRGTIEDVIAFNAESKSAQIFFEANDKLIEQFLENTR